MCAHVQWKWAIVRGSALMCSGCAVDVRPCAVMCSKNGVVLDRLRQPGHWARNSAFMILSGHDSVCLARNVTARRASVIVNVNLVNLHVNLAIVNNPHCSHGLLTC